MQRLHIINVLKSTKGVVEGARGAASIVGINPNTLRSRMKKLGIATSPRGKSLTRTVEDRLSPDR